MPSSPIETSLADLSINQLADKLPALLPFLSGFETITGTKNDENSRCAGLLGFNIGGSDLMIPVLFLNGRIKGMGVIYLSESDTFISADPAWVEYLTSRSSGNAGAPDATNRTNGVPMSALRIFNQPPQVGGYKRAELDSIFEEFLRPEVMLAPAPASLSLPNALRAMGKKACAAFMLDLVENHPAILAKMAEFHPGDELKIEFPETVNDKPVAHDKAAGFIVDGKLSIARINDVHANPSLFTTEQKTAVFRDGMAVIDKRAREVKTQVFADDYASKFSAPTSSGFYKMINIHGELKEVFIAYNAFLIDQPGKAIEGCTIIDASEGTYYLPIVGEEVLTRGRTNLGEDEFDKKFKKLSKISTATANKIYIAVSPRGQVSAPFRVHSRHKSPDSLCLQASTVHSFEDRIRCQSKGNHPSHWPVSSSSNSIRGVTVRIVDSKGGKIHKLGEVVVVPSDWRIMEIDNDSRDCCTSGPESFEEAEKKRDAWEKKQLELKPGNLSVLSKAIQDRAIKSMKLSKRGSDYTILLGDGKSGRCTPFLRKQAALVTLMSSFGFSEEDASSTMTALEKSGSEQIWVKMADIYNGMPFPDSDTYAGTNDLGMRETQTFQHHEEVPMEREPVKDPDDLNDRPTLESRQADFLSRAGDANCKEVFDVGVIGSILKTNRPMAMMDNWLPDIVGALDKACRMLLCFYWKNSDFADAYGADELSELEDLLQENIKSLGTLVLFLKQRAQEGSSTKVDAFA